MVLAEVFTLLTRVRSWEILLRYSRIAVCLRSQVPLSKPSSSHTDERVRRVDVRRLPRYLSGKQRHINLPERRNIPGQSTPHLVLEHLFNLPDFLFDFARGVFSITFCL